MFSCRVHRELQKDIHKDKLLLNKTSIKLNKYAKNENIIVSEYSLGEYIKQKPNRKFILNRWMPYSGIYLRAKDLYVKPQFEARINKSKTKVNAKFDKKIIAAGEDSLKAYKIRTKETKKIKTLDDKLKLGNSVMQSINQELVWVNDTLTENSLNQIELFLESNGFFHANVEIEKKYKRDKRAQNIKYVISENRPHEVVNINYDIQDPNILKILKESINKSELKTGENYSVQKISNERERI